jgi:hypothetical protein
MALMRDYYDPKSMDAEECAKALALIENALDNHLFFEGWTLDRINKFLVDELGWMDGMCGPTHEIEEIVLIDPF